MRGPRSEPRTLRRNRRRDYVRTGSPPQERISVVWCTGVLPERTAEQHRRFLLSCAISGDPCGSLLSGAIATIYFVFGSGFLVPKSKPPQRRRSVKCLAPEGPRLFNCIRSQRSAALRGEEQRSCEAQVNFARLRALIHMGISHPLYYLFSKPI